jgi:WXG100 family type VII secretion target
MADKIRVNYAALEDMAKQCDTVAQRLQDLAKQGNGIGQQMSGGALLGQPGSVFVGALNTFSQKTLKLSAKFTEEANDIRSAAQDMQAADGQAGGKF